MDPEELIGKTNNELTCKSIPEGWFKVTALSDHMYKLIVETIIDDNIVITYKYVHEFAIRENVPLQSNLFGLTYEHKQLILLTAYYAYQQELWRTDVFNIVGRSKKRNMLRESCPKGDAVMNLMYLAKLIIPNFSLDNSMTHNVGIIAMYLKEESHE